MGALVFKARGLAQAVAAVLACSSLVGCGSGPGASPSSPVVGGPVASPTAAASPAAASSTAAASPAAAPATAPESTAASGPATLVTCHDGDHCDVAAGTYRTDENGFLPGLALSVPAGWFLSENDAGELNLHPSANPDDQMMVWWDVRVVVSNHRKASGGTIVDSVAETPAGFVKWFTTDLDFRVLQKPAEATAAGLPGRAVAVGVSTTASYGDPGCPANPRCADFVTDPRHWGGNFYGTGGDASDWMFFAGVRDSSGPHLLVIALEGQSPSDLSTFEAEAKPMLDGIRLPASYTPVN